jgi:transcriptional regulator with XRE-family HTH domain/predicted RNA-binding Zn-ribbon protein involved in translation (DUF1610 family)
MDQEKIGKFISSCRKETGLTQAALADKLGITDRAVSKWETGKSLPDASIMIELCNLLGITVNELLTGEHITMDDYKNKAEANLLEMRLKVEQRDKLLLKVEKIMIGVAIPFYAALILTGAYVCKGGNILLGILLIVMAIVLVAVLAATGLRIEHEAGYYECPNCGERYQPTMKAVVMAPHMGTSRKMICPHCGQKGYHKKVVSKNKE